MTVSSRYDSQPPRADRHRRATPPTATCGGAQAHWVTQDTIAWNPGAVGQAATYRCTTTPTAGSDPRTPTASPAAQRSRSPAIRPASAPTLKAKFPHLAATARVQDRPADLARRARGAAGASSPCRPWTPTATLVDATGAADPGRARRPVHLQRPARRRRSAAGVPTLRVWAPTARSVKLHLFADSTGDARRHACR